MSGYHWPDETIHAMIAMIREGKSANDVAKALGLTRNQVVGKGYRLGFRFGKPAPVDIPQRIVRTWTDEQIAFVVGNLHLTDATLAAEVSRLGPPRTGDAVAKWRVEHGVFRPRNPPKKPRKSQAKPSAQIHRSDGWPKVFTDGDAELARRCAAHQRKHGGQW